LVMKSFSQGSKIKLAMTMILFVLAYQLPQLHPVTMLIGFVLTTATNTISIIWISKRHSTISN
jgi:ATP synthase protein I